MSTLLRTYEEDGTLAPARGVTPYRRLFAPATLCQLQLKNRVAVAPMTRTSATPEGLATAAMARYYASFACGGFGLVICEGTYIDQEYSQGYLNQPGIATDEQAEAWRAVTAAVHEAGGLIVLQLMHAGALSHGNHLRATTVAPSAVQPRGERQATYGATGPYPMPRTLEEAELPDIVRAFGAAARRARDAGFDAVEVHGGNGYLLDQFLTDYTNRRDDAYGGSLQRRLRLPAEVLAAVRRAVGLDYPVSIRISQHKVNDPTHTWSGGAADAAYIFACLARAGADILHVAARAAFDPAFDRGPTLAALAREHGGVPVIANGKLGDPAQAESLLASGDADVIALARPALATMDWPRRVHAGRALDPLTPETYRTLRTLPEPI